MSETAPELRIVTAAGQGALAAIALRGENTLGWLEKCFSPTPVAGRPTYGRLCEADGEVIDDVVLLPTGRDEVLITLHGNPRLVDRVADRLRELGAGEGTASIEEWGTHPALASALALSPHAPTVAGGHFLLAQAERWREWFSPRTGESISTEEIERVLSRAPAGLPFERPPRIAIVGAPNAGKSTLLNRLLGWERVVVDSTPGTTRDRIEVAGVVADRPVTWIDGAGLRDEGGTLERAGMERVREAARSADLRVHLLAVGEAEESTSASIEAALSGGPTLRIRSQIDRVEGASHFPETDGALSAVTGEGIDRFLGAVAETLFGGEDLPTEVTPFTHRQCDRLRAVLARRQRGDSDLDLWAEMPCTDRGEDS